MDSEKIECFKCGRKLNVGDESMGLNLGFGCHYWCRDCCPPTKEKAIEAIHGFMNPPIEKGKVR